MILLVHQIVEGNLLRSHFGTPNGLEDDIGRLGCPHRSPGRRGHPVTLFGRHQNRTATIMMRVIHAALPTPAPAWPAC